MYEQPSSRYRSVFNTLRSAPFAHTQLFTPLCSSQTPKCDDLHHHSMISHFCLILHGLCSLHIVRNFACVIHIAWLLLLLFLWVLRLWSGRWLSRLSLHLTELCFVYHILCALAHRPDLLLALLLRSGIVESLYGATLTASGLQPRLHCLVSL